MWSSAPAWLSWVSTRISSEKVLVMVFGGNSRKSRFILIRVIPEPRNKTRLGTGCTKQKEKKRSKTVCLTMLKYTVVRAQLAAQAIKYYAHIKIKLCCDGDRP